MSKPKAIGESIPEVIAAMKRIEDKARARGFSGPRHYDDSRDQLREETNPEKIESVRRAQTLRNWTQPTEEFKQWWKHHRSAEIKPSIASNCECFRQEFIEAKQFGITEAA